MDHDALWLLAGRGANADTEIVLGRHRPSDRHEPRSDVRDVLPSVTRRHGAYCGIDTGKRRTARQGGPITTETSAGGSVQTQSSRRCRSRAYQSRTRRGALPMALPVSRLADVGEAQHID